VCLQLKIEIQHCYEPHSVIVTLRCSPLRRASKGDGPAASRPFILRGLACDACASHASHLRMTGSILPSRKHSGLLCYARNDGVETVARENSGLVPRTLRSAQRCTAEPRPMHQRSVWLPGSRLYAASLLRDARPPLHHRAVTNPWTAGHLPVTSACLGPLVTKLSCSKTKRRRGPRPRPFASPQEKT
jgi:hypothetical protein